MRIPKKINLGGRIYTVKYGTEKQYPELSRWSAFINYPLRIIVIKKDKQNSEDFNMECFLHEVIHGILEGMYERKLNDNEQFVQLFSRFLHMFLEDLENQKCLPTNK
jgi:hypothetical protein